MGLERLPQLHTTHTGLILSKLILEEEKRLTSILPKLPAAKEREILQVLPSALGQRWADFLSSLVHGSEISTVTVLLSTPDEIART